MGDIFHHPFELKNVRWYFLIYCCSFILLLKKKMSLDTRESEIQIYSQLKKYDHRIPPPFFFSDS